MTCLRRVKAQNQTWGRGGKPGDLLVELKRYWGQNCIFEGHYCTGQVRPDSLYSHSPALGNWEGNAEDLVFQEAKQEEERGLKRMIDRDEPSGGPGGSQKQLGK